LDYIQVEPVLAGFSSPWQGSLFRMIRLIFTCAIR
jgi:hypothetical protein